VSEHKKEKFYRRLTESQPHLESIKRNKPEGKVTDKSGWSWERGNEEGRKGKKERILAIGTEFEEGKESSKGGNGGRETLKRRIEIASSRI